MAPTAVPVAMSLLPWAYSRANGEVTSIREVDGSDQEANPLAIMALPGYATHDKGRIIPVNDGKVTRTIDQVAEC